MMIRSVWGAPAIFRFEGWLLSFRNSRVFSPIKFKELEAFYTSQFLHGDKTHKVLNLCSKSYLMKKIAIFLIHMSFLFKPGVWTLILISFDFLV